MAVRPQHRQGHGREGSGFGAGRSTARHSADQHRPPGLGRHGGSGVAAVPAGDLVRAVWIFRRRMPQSRWFLRAAAVAGVAAVITMEAGWVVTEVGRQPWIVYSHMKVEDAVTAKTGVWITFFAVVILHALVGTTTILVLRGMSRRFREAGG